MHSLAFGGGDHFFKTKLIKSSNSQDCEWKLVTEFLVFASQPLIEMVASDHSWPPPSNNKILLCVQEEGVTRKSVLGSSPLPMETLLMNFVKCEPPICQLSPDRPQEWGT